jgi:hypothetical protein
VESDADSVNVAANDGIEPHTGVIADHHIADDNRTLSDEDTLSKRRQFPFVFK